MQPAKVLRHATLRMKLAFTISQIITTIKESLPCTPGFYRLVEEFKEKAQKKQASVPPQLFASPLSQKFKATYKYSSGSPSVNGSPNQTLSNASGSQQSPTQNPDEEEKSAQGFVSPYQPSQFLKQHQSTNNFHHQKIKQCLCLRAPNADGVSYCQIWEKEASHADKSGWVFRKAKDKDTLKKYWKVAVRRL